MPRKKCVRKIICSPNVTFFKPSGIPLKDLEEIVLHLDELEAIRLVDGEGKYHAEAAECMGVSRQTIGRILESARKKVAHAIVSGIAIRIENVELKNNDMSNLNSKGPNNEGKCTGRGLGKCNSNKTDKQKGAMGKGLGKRRKAGKFDAEME